MIAFRWLLLAFLLVPMAEIYVLVQVGSLIGALPTVFAVVFTAVTGAALIRHQGLATLMRVRGELEQGHLPAEAVLEGVVLLVAGALLLTPGFVTDTVGFGLLIPALRRTVAVRLLLANANVRMHARPGNANPRHPDGAVIEGEYRREND